MRTEQQMIREWADEQGEQNREIKKLLEFLAQPAEEEMTVPLPPAAASRPTSPAAGGEA
jgi:hypothetical protein